MQWQIKAPPLEQGCFESTMSLQDWNLSHRMGSSKVTLLMAVLPPSQIDRYRVMEMSSSLEHIKINGEGFGRFTWAMHVKASEINYGRMSWIGEDKKHMKLEAGRCREWDMDPSRTTPKCLGSRHHPRFTLMVVYVLQCRR